MSRILIHTVYMVVVIAMAVQLNDGRRTIGLNWTAQGIEMYRDLRYDASMHVRFQVNLVDH